MKYDWLRQPSNRLKDAKNGQAALEVAAGRCAWVDEDPSLTHWDRVVREWAEESWPLDELRGIEYDYQCAQMEEQLLQAKAEAESAAAQSWKSWVSMGRPDSLTGT